jgi:hypothetical protein
MDWIFDNPQIALLIALAIGSLVKQMAEAAKAKKEQRDQPQQPEWEETETTWTPIPIPPEFQPPPLYRPTPPPLVQQAAARDDSNELLNKQLEMQEKARSIRDNKAKEKTRMLTLRARSATRAKPPGSCELSVRSLLTSPSTARKAIVLREILDKPVGMR